MNNEDGMNILKQNVTDGKRAAMMAEASELAHALLQHVSTLVVEGSAAQVPVLAFLIAAGSVNGRASKGTSEHEWEMFEPILAMIGRLGFDMGIEARELPDAS